MHQVELKKDHKGRCGKFCPCCGYVSQKCDLQAEKKRKERMKSAPPTHKYYFGYVSKSPLNYTPKQQREQDDDRPGDVKESGGLLGQLKGMLGGRDGVIPRVYRHFEGPPEPQPTHVCFETRMMFSHREVMDSCRAVLSVVANIDGSRVVTLKYIPQKIAFRSRSIGDRWIVQLSSKFAVKKLLETGVTIRGNLMHVRTLDEVQAEEYKQFLGLHKMAKLMITPRFGNRHSAPPIKTM